MTHLSRREFAALAAAAMAAPFGSSLKLSRAAAITAQDLIDRIKKHINVDWKSESVDGLKAGDPSAVVTGIVTTAMATLDVLRQAVKAGANVVITSQPAFYSRTDSRNPPAGPGGRGAAALPSTPPQADPVFAAKNQLIDTYKVAIFRLSEHWRLREPDPLAAGMAQAMGWAKYQSPGERRRVDVPALTLQSLVGAVSKNLRTRGGIRVVGDPQTTVRRVGLLPGSTPIQACLKMLPNVDVILAGEVREWESVEYARDIVSSGEAKGLILVGRVVSEEPGMNACAEWLKTFVLDVPIRHISAGDPYWRPA
jgi:putative NIF3 family GTP cyclohydrolase 1 type 2